MTLGQGQELTLTFNTHISSLSQLVSGHRLQKFWKNQQFSLFPIDKPKLPNFHLNRSRNRSRSTYHHHLNKLWQAGVTNATYQVSWKSVHRFRRRRFLKGFYHIWAWWPSWRCDHHRVNKFSFPNTWKLMYKIWLWLTQWFLRKASFNSQM